MRKAFSDEQKEARRRAILDAAAALLQTTEYAKIGMQDVANAAGLAKGTVYLYFETREELFSTILEEQMDCWFEEVDKTLAALGPSTPERVAEIFADSIEMQSSFGQLLVIAHSILDRNVAVETILEVKRRHLACMRQTGELLETCLPELPKGSGTSVLRFVYAMALGVRNICNPSPAFREAIRSDPSLQVFLADFRTDMITAVTALLRGFGTAPS